MRDESSAKKLSSAGESRSALDLAVAESTPRSASRTSTFAASRPAFAFRAGTTSARATPGCTNSRMAKTAATARPLFFTRSLVVVNHVIGQAQAGREHRGAPDAFVPQV